MPRFSPPLKQQAQRLRPATKWVIDAAIVEPRVAVALVLVSVLFAVSSLVWAFVIVASGQGVIAGFLGWLFLTLILSTGISFPLFVPLAWPALWLREVVRRDGKYHEAWVNPKKRTEAPFNEPGFMRRLNGKRYLFAIDNGDGTYRPLRPRRKDILYTTTDVYKAIEQTPLYRMFLRNSRFPAMPIRAGAIAVIIGLVMFLGFALVTNPESFTS